MLSWGYLIPFSSFLSSDPIPFIRYSPGSIKGNALLGEIQSLVDKGAVELAPPSPGFYSCLFVVFKVLGSWQPVIDLSLLNKFVLQTKFKMETNQSVLRAVRKGDWMISIDLKDAYLQVPVHPGSRRYLHFMAFGKSINSRSSASVSPWPLRCLPGSWLQFRPYFTVWESRFFAIWTINWFSSLPSQRLCGQGTQFLIFVAS